MDAQQNAATALTRLVTLADGRRLTRSADRSAVRVVWVNGGFSAVVTSAEPGRTYDVRVQVEGQRSFRCSCPDHTRHVRGDHRPCKHVVALAAEVLDDIERETRLGG